MGLTESDREEAELSVIQCTGQCRFISNTVHTCLILESFKLKINFVAIKEKEKIKDWKIGYERYICIYFFLDTF